MHIEPIVATAQTEEENEGEGVRPSSLSTVENDSEESVVEESCNGSGMLAPSTPHNIKRRNRRNIHNHQLEGWEMVCPIPGDTLYHAETAFRVATPRNGCDQNGIFPSDSPSRAVSPIAFGILNKPLNNVKCSRKTKNVFHISREAERKSSVGELHVEFPAVPLHVSGKSQSLSDVVNPIFWKNREIEEKLLESMSDIVIPKDIAQFAMRRDGHVLVAMVGLPARGKSFIAKALCRHLNWLGIGAGIFNAGNYRRKVVMDASSNLFDPSNEKGAAIRHGCAKAALEAAFQFLAVEGHYVAFFDATNTTRERRRWIQDEVNTHVERKSSIVDTSGHGEINDKIQLVFLESQCHDNQKILENIRDAKIRSPDYEGWKEYDIMMDFLSRIKHYESVYKHVSEDENFPYIRLENNGSDRERLVVYKCKGYALGRIMQLLNHLTLSLRCIILTRPGETYETSCGIMGSGKRSTLTPAGTLYADKFASAIEHLSFTPDSAGDVQQNVHIWTAESASALQFCMPLAKLGIEINKLSALNDLDFGAMEGMTKADFALLYPDEFKKRCDNKLNYCFPGGESYSRMFQRLEPLLLELLGEETSTIIVSHTTVLRVIYGYLIGVTPEESVRIDIPLNCAIKLWPQGYGYSETHYYPFST